MCKGLLATAALLASVSAAGAATISTLDATDGKAIYWGLTNTPAYGQTVTLAHAAKIQTFAFSADDNGAAVNYEFQVYAWDGDSLTGSALYTVPGQTSGNPGFTSHVIELGDLPLEAGEYVLLLVATTEGAAAFATSEDAYSEGSWIYQEDSWYVDERVDLSFEITYDVSN